MKNRKPMHIGIIPDGNRRWAEQHKLSREAGYAYGLKPGLLLLQQAKTYGIQEITYYGFTVDNCRRPKEQVQAFQQACVQAVHDLATEGVDLLVIGNTDSKCFPEELKKYTNRTAINGGGIRLVHSHMIFGSHLKQMAPFLPLVGFTQLFLFLSQYIWWQAKCT